MVIPPDGGFGWIVLVLSFIAQLIVDGIIFSVGILLPHISAELEVSNAQVVLVGSVQIGCYFLGGAFSSALINSYGFRPVAMFGVAISALAMLAASYSVNLPMMIVFYSTIGGPGLSMIWVSSQLIISYYFERYRPIASGFSCSGAGLGIIFFSMLNSYLVTKIGWRNTVRVQVGFVLLLFLIVLAYLEVAPTPVGVVHRREQQSGSSSEEYYGNFYVHNFIREDATSQKSRAKLETYEPEERQRRWTCASPCCRKRTPKSEEQLSDGERNYLVRADPLQHDDLFYTGPADYDAPHSKERFEGKDLELMGSQKQIQRAAYGLHKIHDYNDGDSDDDDKDAPAQPAKHSGSAHHLQKRRRKKQKKRHWLHTRMVRAFNRLFDVHLFKSFAFRVLVASAFVYPMGFNIPFVYSKMRTTIPPSYAQFIGPAIGATNFLARISCGFVAYKLTGWTNYICGGGMVLGGAVVLISAFYGSDLIWFQLLYGMCYGVAPAVFATLRALIYVRYLGLSKLTNAFGITALAMGLGVFIGTTLGGILVDKTGGYMVPFAFAGLCIIVAGSLTLILPSLLACRQQ
ncbi:uncharacterized protein LOC108595439 isoform X2 [Drosophila busckii]|nr:uncharacterized protein LOC108595439 isoform X2 [Drosophila busckii]